MKRILITVLILVLLICGYLYYGSHRTAVVTPETQTTETVATTSAQQYQFAPANNDRLSVLTAKSGDMLGGFLVKDIQQPDEFGQFSATFNGTTTVTGAYGTVEIPGAFCFTPTSDSAYKIPRFREDERYAWFCFSNEKIAEDALGASGSATIEISDYKEVYAATEATDQATFVRVISK